MSAPTLFLGGRVALHAGDCRETIAALPAGSIDAVVTDPPYALVSIVKRFGGEGAAPAKDGDVYARSSAGFMGKRWDTGETAFAVGFWREVLRVLKPGGHVVAMSGTRTYHRLALAIEDAGFEIRDQLAWCYGTGFPKSHNVGDGWGTALKPAWEPIVLARKPIAGTVAENVRLHGVGALNVDGCRVGTDVLPAIRRGISRIGTFEGADGNVTPERAGRWPANIVHDGSDEVAIAFGDAAPSRIGKPRSATAGDGWGMRRTGAEYSDAGSASRFFYSAKADAADRIGSKHPTVKPVDLMAWLCRLVTPAGGVVLDPFAGTGTTGEAAWREGFSAVLCEREPEYLADIARRMALAEAGPATRRAETAKARGRSMAAAPLFDLPDAEAAE